MTSLTRAHLRFKPPGAKRALPNAIRVSCGRAGTDLSADRRRLRRNGRPDHPGHPIDEHLREPHGQHHQPRQRPLKAAHRPTCCPRDPGHFAPGMVNGAVRRRCKRPRQAVNSHRKSRHLGHLAFGRWMSPRPTSRRRCSSTRQSAETELGPYRLQRRGLHRRGALLALRVPNWRAARLTLPRFATEDPADNVSDEEYKNGAQSNRSHDQPRLGGPSLKTVHRATFPCTSKENTTVTVNNPSPLPRHARVEGSSGDRASILVLARAGPPSPAPKRIADQASRALLAQLARIGQHDLRLPLVIADLPRHTDALAAEGGLGGPEFRAVLPIHDRGEGSIRRGLPEVQ